MLQRIWKIVVVAAALTVGGWVLQARAAESAAPLWQEINEAEVTTRGSRRIVPQAYRTFALNQEALADRLAQAPLEYTSAAGNPVAITLPLPDGSLARFAVRESPFMQPEDTARMPDLKMYAGRGIDDPAASVRFVWRDAGLHAYLHTPAGASLIDPYSSEDAGTYVAYWFADRPPLPTGPLDDPAELARDDYDVAAPLPGAVNQSSGPDVRLVTIAVTTTGEYGQWAGGKAAAEQAVIDLVNDTNAIWEPEVGVRFVLALGFRDLIWDDPMADPFPTGDEADGLLAQNQDYLNSVLGPANYDVGHLLSTQGGGVAGLGSACRDSSKGRGRTGYGNLLVFSHEVGHQFGADHTFNGTDGSCGDNISSRSAYEPGSGSSIMSYGGLCVSHNITLERDPNFHTHSFEQMRDHLDAFPACGTTVSNGNQPPVVSVPAGGFTIPMETPFELTGSAVDPDGDTLSFSWEQMDLGPAGHWATPSGNAPLFRSFPPQSSGARAFPRLEKLLVGDPSFGEVLPDYARSLTFRLTARDNQTPSGGVAYDTVTFDVTDAAGPFRVTTANDPATVWPALGTVEVTWDPAGTQAAPVSCSHVRIRLSTANGATWPTVLAASTPNDGSHIVTLPATSTSAARLRIDCVDNIFFAINDAPFTIKPPVIGINGAACTYMTLNDALAAASSGDTLYLMADTYQESFAVLGKDITLTKAASGCATKSNSGNVIIDAQRLGRVGSIEDGTLILENVTLTRGEAGSGNGGGLLAINSSVIMASAVITDSDAAYGAGIYLGNSDLIMRGSSVIGQGSASQGGGVFVDATSSLQMEDDALLFSGYATSGGNLYSRGVVTLQGNAALRDGYAFGSGGGLYMDGGTLVAAGNTLIETGTAFTRGGGIYATGVFSVTLRDNVQIVDNFGDDGGGGGAFDSADGAVLIEGSVRIARNDTQSNGGGLWFAAGAQGAIRGSVWIYGNNTRSNGGGVYINQGSQVTVSENVLIGAGPRANGNTTESASVTTGVGGGGAAVFGEDSLLILEDSVRVYQNLATFGGGLRAAGGARLEIHDSVLVQENTARYDGGGVYVDDADTLLLMTSGTRLNANGSESATARGGGLAVSGYATVQLNGVIIDANSAIYGGGIYHTTGSLSVSGGAISGNTATAQGGGVRAGNPLTMTNTLIDANSAPEGGGIYLLNNPDALLDGIRVTGNDATDGAGIYVRGATTVRLLGPWLENNVATDEGGGLYASGAVDVDVQGGNILSNGAVLGGGIFASTDAQVIVSDARLVGNSATSLGGGVMVERSASVTLRSAFSNGGSALCSPDVKPADNYCMELRENTAGSSGGGAYATSATLVISHTAVLSNSAPAAAGVMLWGTSTGRLAHSLVSGHSGDWSVDSAGGSNVDVRFTTIAGNDRGLRLQTVNAALHGSIVWDNALAGVDLVDTDVPLQATCNNTQDLLPVGSGNISSDPLFTTTGRGMYRLAPASPSSDACAAGDGPDLDNRPRPGGAAYDMGAFESLFALIFVVDSSATDGDTAPGDGVCDAGSGACTLQAALDEANARPVRDVIQLGSVTINESGLQIDYPVEIQGAGPTESVIDGQLTGPLFVVNASAGETIVRDVSLRNGSGGTGGALFASSDLTLFNVTISGSRAAQGGGVGVQGSAAVTISNSVLHDNQALSSAGGALVHAGTGPVLLVNVTVSGNSTNSFGGGIAHTGPGDLTLTNVTVSANSANQDGGGIYRAPFAGSFTLQNTVVSGNSNSFNDAPDCAGSFQLPGGYGVIGQLTGLCSFNETPLHTGPVTLGPLQENGGGTLTHAIVAGGAAHNSGSDAVCPAVDQRGLLRDAQCDMGAYEVGAAPTAIGLRTMRVVAGGAPALVWVLALLAGISGLVAVRPRKTSAQA